jgi:serine/threonine-protein kinase RsbW
MPTKTFPGRYDNLAKIRRFVSRCARQAGLDEKAVYAVKLAVDEACSNIIEHAYGGEDKGDIKCTCQISEGALTIILRDEGRSFDPEKVPEPRKDVPLKKIKPRGAGLYLIRQLMDEVVFDFSEGEGNTLSLVKYIGR